MAGPQKLAISTLWLLAACSTARPPESPEVGAVVVSPAAPPADYVRVKQLDVVSGRGCGVMGERGSPEGAQAKLRSEAARLGASYVQIISAEKPPINHQCMEHAHKLSGVAYREPEPTPAPIAKPAAAAAAPSPTSLAIQNYEGAAPASKAAAATQRSHVALTLVPGDGSQNALSVDYACSGDDQRADLDVWSAPLGADWTRGNALTLRIKPDAALSLSVSFMDGNHAVYTQQTEPLVAGQWQTVTLPFDKFWLNPFGPPGNVKGAPQDRTNVQAFGFAPKGCTNGHFLIDDIALAK